MKTKMTARLWWILFGMKQKEAMPADQRINFYRNQKQALLRFGLTIKLLIIIPTICLMSCKKEVPAPTPAKQFTATVFLTPTSQTVAYDVFLSNDKNAPINLWIWALRIDKPKSNPFSFGFDFTGLVCNGVLYADPNKKLYGATRELVAHGERLDMNYNSIIIK